MHFLKVLAIERIQNNLSILLKNNNLTTDTLLKAIYEVPKQLFNLAELSNLTINTVSNAYTFVQTNFSFFYKKSMSRETDASPCTRVFIPVLSEITEGEMASAHEPPISSLHQCLNDTPLYGDDYIKENLQLKRPAYNT